MRTERHNHGRHGHRLAKLAMLKAAKFGGGWGGSFGGGGFGGWDEDGHDGRRGGRGRRMFGGGELRLVLLKLIAHEPRHGYQLIKAVEDLTQGAYAPSPGVVYPTLSLLADEGAVREVEGEVGGGGARKAFAITEQGAAELADKQAEVERILARLADHGEGRRHGPPPQVARALGNLLTVLRQAKHEEHTQDLHNAIVDIIDEAAKRIERL